MSSLKMLAVAALATGLVATLAGCAHREAVKPGPDFSLKDSNGQNVKLSEYRGQVVLLNFWATWCGPCKVEIPWFMEFQRKYKDQKFAVLGVSMDDDGWDGVRKYINEHKFNYRVVIGDDMTGKQFGGVEDLPTTFILDRSGHVAVKHVGLVSKEIYEGEIQEQLKSRQITLMQGAPAGPFAFAKLP
ncbi:MAG TPA: TlpA disulfide reductase family protein [Bryobacteraceae bacterium]